MNQLVLKKMDFKINTQYQFKYLNIEYLNTPKTKQRIS